MRGGRLHHGLQGHLADTGLCRELYVELGRSGARGGDCARCGLVSGWAAASEQGRLAGEQDLDLFRRPVLSPDLHGELRRLAQDNEGKLADALTFRQAVETGAAEALAQLVAQSAARPDTTQALLARLAEVNAACPQDYRRLDTLFHLSIAELTGSSLLTAACGDARMRLNDLLNAIPVLQRNIDHTAGQHAEIVNAILDGDGARARRAMAEHIAGTAALLRGFLA